MTYSNCARNSVFDLSDPLGVPLRVWKQGPFHSTPKNSLQASHPPSHQPLSSPGYAPHKVAWPQCRPTQQGVGHQRLLPQCLEVKVGNERPQGPGRRPEPAFRQLGASIPRQPRSPQLTGELINDLQQLRQK